MSDLFGTARWSNAELAEVFGLSAQRLGVLCKQGVLPLPTDGLHDPKLAVAAYVRHLKAKQEGTTQAGETVKKMQLENEMRRIKLQRIAGELVPVERVQKNWFDATRRVRDGLLNLPSRLSGVFAAESSQGKIFESFTNELHTLLEELSKGQTMPAHEQITLDETAAVASEAPAEMHSHQPEESDHVSDDSARFAMGD